MLSLSLFLLSFKALFFLHDILILTPEGLFYFALPHFIFDHLLLYKLVISQNFFVLSSFFMKFLLPLKKLFELRLLKIRFGNFIVEQADLSVVFKDIFLQEVDLVVEVLHLAFAEKLWILFM